MITSAVPYFWVAMVLVLIFGITLHWLPYIGGYDVAGDTPALSPAVPRRRLSGTPSCPRPRC